MALTVKHGFTSPIADDSAAAAANEVLPSHWNANHTLTGSVAFSELSGSVAASQMPALTGDVTSSAGTVATTVVNISTHATMAGDVVATNVAAPSTPASGKTTLYTDSTNKVLSAKNDAGTVSNTVVPSSAGSHQFATGVSAAGAVSYAQPAFTDVSGSVAGSQMPALTGDVTMSAGSTTTTLTNIPSDTTMAGDILASVIAAPTTPAATKARIYVDSTDKTLKAKNDAGTVSTTVVAASAVSHQFVTAISSAGAVSQAQPAFTDISGSVAGSQMPALTGDVTSSAGSTTTTLANIPNDVPMAGDVLATAVTAPSTPAAGKGRIYVDSTDKTLKHKSDAGTVSTTIVPATAGTGQFASAVSSAGVITFSTPVRLALPTTTFYVRSDGNNSNNGQANTSGGAWLTLQHAMDVLSGTYDLGGQGVTVNIGSGTFAGFGVKSCVGGGYIYFNGAGVASTTLQGGPNDGTYNKGEIIGWSIINTTVIYMNNVLLQPTALSSFNNETVLSMPGGGIMEFQAPTGAASGTITIDNSSTTTGHVFGIQGTGSTLGIFCSTLNYSGNAASLVRGFSPCQIYIFPTNFNVNSTPAWGTAMIYVNDLTWLQSFTTFSGSATGKRYAVANNGVVNTFGSGANYFPGNVAGTTTAGGQYI